MIVAEAAIYVVLAKRRADSLAWARRLGLAAAEHIGMAARGTDHRIAHEYHELRAVNFARKAAHHAFLAAPEIRQ